MPPINLPEPDFLRTTFEVKSLDKDGAFAGYAAVWDEVDRNDDVCVQGCFADTLAVWAARGTWPRLRWQHYDAIGHITAAREDDHGLFVEGLIWDADVAEVIRTAVEQSGVGMSFAFVDVGSPPDIRGGVRYLRKVALVDDVTITLRPVQTSAELLEVKSGDRVVPSVRSTEGILRDAGYSRKEARAVLSGGYSALCDAGEPAILAGLDAIRNTLNKIAR